MRKNTPEPSNLETIFVLNIEEKLLRPTGLVILAIRLHHVSYNSFFQVTSDSRLFGRLWRWNDYPYDQIYGLLALFCFAGILLVLLNS